jgi:hypothetical protein
MAALYDPNVLLDPSCFSFLYHCQLSMPDQLLLKNAPPSHHSKLPTNAVPLKHPKLTSLSLSNQDAILLAAVGGAQSMLPPVSKPAMSIVRLQSGHVPGQIPSSSIQLMPTLAAELKNNIIDAGSDFINRLFPWNRSPFPISKKLYSTLANNNLYNLSSNRFILPSACKEEPMCAWLNEIGQAIADTNGVTMRRRWYHGSKNLPPSGSHFALKPDIVLLEHDYHAILESLDASIPRVSWLQV